ncbi:MAG: 2-oxoacid:acceptor oxidoreductase subunit alpha [Spirochaetaceae bacterium]
MKKDKPLFDYVIRIAGEGGDGIISCGELLAQAAARTEFHVFTFITYPAEMRGGYSMIQIRISDVSILSMGSFVDCLVVFNGEALENSIEVLKEGGVLIYEPELVDVSGLEEKYTLLPISFGSISKEAAAGKVGKNVVALGTLCRLLGIREEMMEKLLGERYGEKGTSVVEGNKKRLAAGFAGARKAGLKQRFALSELNPSGEEYMFISGNQAVALGAIAAGCRFCAGYPITPATSIFETLTKLMPLVGGRAIQMEDEIAAISAIIGASFAGEKVITPTSGPGLQLMTEQLSYASMIEVPVVIVDVQRAGPSTGLPTKTEQSDLKFAVYGTTGDSPRIILAPTTVEDTFYQTIRAFNLAEKYQVPVLMLLDQSIGYRKATVKMPDFTHFYTLHGEESRKNIGIPKAEMIRVRERIYPTREQLENYRRYEDTEDGISPFVKPGTPGGEYLATGLEHDEYGVSDQSPKNHLKMSKKRIRKIKVISRAFERNPVECYGDPDACIGIIGWGSTEGAIREACMLAEEQGIKVRHFHPHTINPLPERQISIFLARIRQLIIVEENLTGQFAHFIRAQFGVDPIMIHKCEGVPITSEEIYRGIMKVGSVADEEHITEA